jgi:hypothetical protein
MTGDIFLGRSRIYPTLLGQCERLPHTACHGRIRVVCIRFLLQDIHQFESPLLLDMSNHLSCGHQHIVNLLEWWKIIVLAY